MSFISFWVNLAEHFKVPTFSRKNLSINFVNDDDDNNE
jgi:hypothetical protein